MAMMSSSSAVVKTDTLTRWDASFTGSDADASTSKPSKFPVREDLNKMLILCQEDITSLLVDAIVNTTNERLNDRTGISGRIHLRAGPDLAADCIRLEGCHTGEAVISKGYELPASYVIHTVGPRFSVKYQTAAENALHGCYRRSLEVLKENGLESIAFPVVNTERKGYPKEAAAHIAIRTIRRFLEKFGGVPTIVLCMDTPEDLKIYEKVLPLYFPRNKKEEQYAVTALPKDTGNELGESVIAERKIRISSMPGRNDDEEEEEEEEYTAAGAVDDEEDEVKTGNDSFTAVQENPDDIRRKFDTSKSKEEIEREEAERRYQVYLARANEEDLSDIAEYNFVYQSGFDTYGRPVIVLVANKIPAATVDKDRLLYYFISVLDPIVSKDYTMVYCHTNIESHNKPEMAWLRSAYGIFNRKYKKNMKRLFVVHPSFWVKMVFWFATPFVSSKFWKKLITVERLADLYGELNPQTLQLPDDIVKYDAETNPGDYTGSAPPADL